MYQLVFGYILKKSDQINKASELICQITKFSPDWFWIKNICSFHNKNQQSTHNKNHLQSAVCNTVNKADYLSRIKETAHAKMKILSSFTSNDFLLQITK